MSLRAKTFVISGLVCLGIGAGARAGNIFVSTDTNDTNSDDQNNYIVGADTSLNPLAGSATFTVTGNVYGDTTNALFGPYGYIFDVGVFGAYQCNVVGSTQGLDLLNSSVGTISDGFSQNSSVYDSASLTINGGISNNNNGYLNSTTTLNFGQVNDYAGYQNAVLNVNGGTVGSATLNDNSVLNINAGTVTTLATSAGTTTNITGTGAVTNNTGNGAINYYGSHGVILNLPAITLAQPVTLNLVSTPSITEQTSTVVLTNPTTIVVGSVQLQNDSIFAMLNGTINNLTAANSANVTLVQGGVNSATVSGQATLTADQGVTLPLVSVFGQGTATIAEAIVSTAAGKITAQDDATIGLDLTGSISPSASPTLVTPAGVLSNTFEVVDLLGQSKLNVYSNTNLELSSLGAGSDSNGAFNGYAIFAIDPGSSPIDTNIRVQDYNGLSPGNPNLGSANTGNVDFLPAPIPEPTTLSLVAVAALSLLGTRRRRA